MTSLFLGGGKSLATPFRLLLLGSLGFAGACSENGPSRPAWTSQVRLGYAANTGADVELEGVLASLDQVERQGTKLVVEARRDRIERRDPALSGLLREIKRRRIPYMIWPLFNQSEGFYPNETNGREFLELTQRLYAWLSEEGLFPEWILVDMEPSEGAAADLLGNIWSGSFDTALSHIREAINPVAFDEAARPFRELVDWAHANGLKVHLDTIPFVVDDLEDGDVSLQDALGLPVTMIEWDEYSLMVYRTLFRMFIGGMEFSPRLIYDYATSIREHFGPDKAAIAVGLVANYPYTPDSISQGYHDPTELKQDIEASLSAGVDDVYVFSWLGVLWLGGPERWFNFDLLSPQVPKPDVATDTVRAFFQALDRAL